MSETQENNSIDLTNVELFRGVTPHDITLKCLQLCQQYLSGVWINLTANQIIVKRVSGGLTNQIYYCAINEDKRRTDIKEPQEVIIRLYQPKFFNDLDSNSREHLTDTIIAQLVSEKGMGPKIYGLFSGGQIQKYYKHRCFEVEEQKDRKIVEEVARRLAQIHAMDVPIKKTGNWIFEFFDDCYKKANERFDLNELIDSSDSQTLKTFDVGKELEWLKNAVLICNSPHTFSHIDYRESNILITESDGILLCDFDYSCYGYRGFDFGTLFCDWGRVWGQLSKHIQYPSDDTIIPFINSYIEESAQLKGKLFTEDKRNSLEIILNEVKLFSLVAIMWTVMFHLQINESIIVSIPFNKLQSMQRIESHYQRYHTFKRMFAANNVFKNTSN